MFKGWMIENRDGNHTVNLTEIDETDLPQGDVLIDVSYSNLNYKDALAITSKAPVVRQFPMVPGIDMAGRVLTSTNSDVPEGTSVLLTGWGLGEKHWGGLAQKARVNSDWIVPLPDGIDERQAMAIGTAGYTAMLCVMALEQSGIKPGMGEILVTGAAGGVGSVAVSILAKLGFEVVALTGRPNEASYLKYLGASKIMARGEMSSPGKPIQKERWSGVIDVAGSHVLANACASTRYGGVVVACGMTAGLDFPATVAPFILRGVTLIGIDSVMSSTEQREKAWYRLSQDLDIEKLEAMVEDISLHQVKDKAIDIINGKVRGRVVVSTSS